MIMNINTSILVLINIQCYIYIYIFIITCIKYMSNSYIDSYRYISNANLA